MIKFVITPEKDIQDYYNSPRLSQSTLKKLCNGVDSYLAKKDEDISSKKSIILGKAIDCRLLSNPDDFKNQFYISNMNTSPSDLEKAMLEEVFSRAKSIHGDNVSENLTDYRQFLEEVIISFNYYANRKLETNLSNLTNSGSSYFQELVESNGKTIISLEDMMVIDNVVKSLKTNERTKKLFTDYVVDDEIEIWYQKPLFFDIEVDKRKVECKALLDICVVVMKEGSPLYISPVDLKTMHGYTIDFADSAFTFRYDIQASFYTKALEVCYPNAIINPFSFVVESVSNIGKPLIYVTNDSIIEGGEFGFKRYGKQQPGYRDLISNYLYQEETGWKEDKIVTDNNGVLLLSMEGGISKI